MDEKTEKELIKAVATLERSMAMATMILQDHNEKVGTLSEAVKMLCDLHPSKVRSGHTK